MTLSSDAVLFGTAAGVVGMFKPLTSLGFVAGNSGCDAVNVGVMPYILFVAVEDCRPRVGGCERDVVESLKPAPPIAVSEKSEYEPCSLPEYERLWGFDIRLVELYNPSGALGRARDSASGERCSSELEVKLRAP